MSQTRCFKRPCKQKSLVVNKFKLKIFEVLPEDNPEMPSVYYYLATGENKNQAWFRSIDKEIKKYILFSIITAFFHQYYDKGDRVLAQ